MIHVDVLFERLMFNADRFNLIETCWKRVVAPIQHVERLTATMIMQEETFAIRRLTREVEQVR